MSLRPRLKICGVTNREDAALIGHSGADYCGILVNVRFSERSLSLRQAREVASAAGIPVIILLCDPDAEEVVDVAETIKPFALQLLCHEPPDFVSHLKSRVNCQLWKTIHLPAVSGQASPEAYVRAGADALLVDSVDSSEGFSRLGGTGKVADWDAAAKIISSVSVPVFLAGGINPDNVAQAIRRVGPYGIDLCSGVEQSMGRKDPAKVRLLVDKFKTAIATIGSDENESGRCVWRK